MDCNARCFWCPCNIAFLAILLFCLSGSLVTGILTLLTSVGDVASLPTYAWAPLAATGAAATLWGLWLGFRNHSRPEPLIVGVLGIVGLLVGFATWRPLALFGVVIVMGAAIWGALVFAPRTRETYPQ